MALYNLQKCSSVLSALFHSLRAGLAGKPEVYKSGKFDYYSSAVLSEPERSNAFMQNAALIVAAGMSSQMRPQILPGLPERGNLL